MLPIRVITKYRSFDNERPNINSLVPGHKHHFTEMLNHFINYVNAACFMAIILQDRFL